jgi:O-antigen ligase
MFVFGILYIISTLLLYFSGIRSAFIPFVVIHFFLLLIPNIQKNKKNILAILVIVISTHVFGMTFVGYTDHNKTMLGRLVRTCHIATQNISLFVKDIKNNKIPNGTDQSPIPIDISAQSSAPEENKIPNDTNQSSIPKENKIPNGTNQYGMSVIADVYQEPIKKMTRDEYTQELVKQKNFNMLFESRTRLWLDGINKIKSSPILGNEKRINGWTSHNTFLDVTIGTGIVGGMLYLIILLCGCRDAVLAIRKTPELSWLGLIYFFEIMLSIFSGPVIERAYFWWFSIVALRANILEYK